MTDVKIVRVITPGAQGVPGETSPQTLEARAFVAAKATEVGGKADQVATDAATVATKATDVEADRAEVATKRDETVAARDAAQTASTQAVATVTAGRVAAATLAGLNALTPANGAVGEVTAGADAGYYLRTGGAWVKQSSISLPALEPIAGAIDAAYSQIDADKPYIWSLTGPDGKVRELASVAPDGVLNWPSILAGVLSAGQITSGGQTFYGYETLEPGDIILVDSLGKITGTLTPGASVAVETEIAAARGSQSNLAARLSVALDGKGNPLEPAWGLYRLRQTRWKLRNLDIAGAYAGTTYPTTLNLALIGDSYTAGPEWTEPLTKSLRKQFGDASGGFINLRGLALIPFIVTSEVTVSLSGTWTDAANAGPTPDRGYCQSTTAASKITVNTNVAKAPTLMRLYYVPTADGQVRYRWNGGTWTNLSLVGSALAASVDLAGLPGAAATWTLEVEVVSGDVRLAGFYHTYAGIGVRVNKIAQSGSSAAGWGGANAVATTEWQGFMAGMGIDLFTVMFGANDQPSSTPPVIAARLLTIAQSCKTACPAADVLIVMQPENHLGRTLAMKDITAAVRDMCVANKIPFVDTQYLYGDTDSEYAIGGPRDWLGDGLHPSRKDGAFVMADAYYRAITQGF